MNQLDSEEHAVGIASFAVALMVTPTLMRAAGKDVWGVVFGVHDYWSRLVGTFRRSHRDHAALRALIVGLSGSALGIWLTVVYMGTSLAGVVSGLLLVVIGLHAAARPGADWSWRRELAAEADGPVVLASSGFGRSRRLAAESHVAPPRISEGLTSGVLLPRH